MKQLKVIQRELIISSSATIFYTLWGIERLADFPKFLAIILDLSASFFCVLQAVGIFVKTENYDELAIKNKKNAGDLSFRLYTLILLLSLLFEKFFNMSEIVPLSSFIPFSLALSHIIYMVCFILFEKSILNKEEDDA